MRLADQAVHEGNWLFRHRSFLPLLLLPLVALAVPDAVGIERRVGEGWHDVWGAACLVVSLAGLALRAVTVGFAPDGTSGRDTRAQRAEVLNTSGVYSVVRHPLYIGNSIAMLGIVCSLMVPWLAAMTVLLLWLYHERIMLAEEHFLRGKFGESFDRWTDETPAVWPAFSRWRPPVRHFSWRRVLRSEFNGLLAIVSVFTLVEAATDMRLTGMGPGAWMRQDWGWVAVFGAAAAIFLVLATIKKGTSWLRE
jgi:protein-S-isoprenylcysteine O-methyltransferase Ste14